MSQSSSCKISETRQTSNNIGQLSDSLLADVGFECDVDGTSNAFLILLDEGTDWMVCKYLGVGQHTRSAQQLYQAAEDGWISWAGPPDVFVADNERGFYAEIFFTKLGQAGTLYNPTAEYAPWQKGKVERKIQSFKAIIRKTVMYRQCKADEMKVVGIEAATALNQRPDPTGVSAAMMLFGQRLAS